MFGKRIEKRDREKEREGERRRDLGGVIFFNVRNTIKISWCNWSSKRHHKLNSMICFTFSYDIVRGCGI
jgi:hypothetical protein